VHRKLLLCRLEIWEISIFVLFNRLRILRDLYALL